LQRPGGMEKGTGRIREGTERDGHGERDRSNTRGDEGPGEEDRSRGKEWAGFLADTEKVNATVKMLRKLPLPVVRKRGSGRNLTDRTDPQVTEDPEARRTQSG
jgi:hypothetical protein